VDLPATFYFPGAFAADLVREQRSEELLPLAYGLVRELEASQQEHLAQISQG
jgi:hypothetical protein